MASPLIPTARHRPRALQVAVASLVLWSSSMAVVLAADPVSESPVRDPHRLLERELADVALVDQDPTLGTVDLLTLDTSGDPGSMRLALLHGDETWTLLSEAPVVPAEPVGGQPWLVDLGDGEFAVIAPLETERGFVPHPQRSTVIPVTVDSSAGGATLDVGSAIEVGERVTDAGAADVDGDGVAELVLAGEGCEDGDTCLGPTIAILSGRGSLRLDRQTTIAIEGWDPCTWMPWSALGAWDDHPGVDILAHVVTNCGPYDIYDTEPMQPGSDRLVAVRLSDLSTIVDVPSDVPGALDNPPLVLDVDADGRDEAVLSGNGQLSLLDPIQRWQRLLVADGDVTLLDASVGEVGTPAATMTWMGLTPGPSGSGIRTARVVRVDGSLAAEGLTLWPFTDRLLAEVERLIAAPQGAWFGNGPADVMAIDVDLDGCVDLVAPLLFAGCRGTRPPQVGPPFVASRPLLAIGSTDNPRLLVSQSLGWGPPYDPRPWEPGPPTLTPGLMDAPAPVLAYQPGSWRQQPWAPFQLAEAPIGDALPGSAADIAAPIVGTVVAADGSITVQGPDGARILLRVQELCDCHVNGPIDLAGSWEVFVSTRVQGFEFDEVARIPRSSVAGREERRQSARISLAPAWGGRWVNRGPWLVTAVALDDLGRPTAPAAAAAVYDDQPPPVQLDAPFVSAPWPFDASLSGSSEPGISVRVGDELPVIVGDTGQFRLPAQLAPWPQTLEVTAVDPAGNTTTTSVSVMGGLDVRQISGPAILMVGILVVAFASSIRGGRRPPRPAEVRPANSATTYSGPVIEELWERDLPPDG